jgi:hypothetical protein
MGHLEVHRRKVERPELLQEEPPANWGHLIQERGGGARLARIGRRPWQLARLQTGGRFGRTTGPKISCTGPRRPEGGGRLTGPGMLGRDRYGGGPLGIVGRRAVVSGSDRRRRDASLQVSRNSTLGSISRISFVRKVFKSFLNQSESWTKFKKNLQSNNCLTV